MRYIALVFLLIFVGQSCQKEVDTESPTIALGDFSHPMQILNICGNDEPNSFRLTGGDTFSFTAELKDNEQLSQLKIDIHNNFDCHGHGGSLAPGISVHNLIGKTDTWNLQKIEKINGSELTREFYLAVPQNVTSGDYHFGIQVLDKSGNEQENRTFYSLKVKNPFDSIPPVVEITDIIGVSDNDIIKRGNTIRMIGKVRDNRNLAEGGNGLVFINYRDNASNNNFGTNSYYVFKPQDGAENGFDLSFTIPQTLPEGSYTFFLIAFDGVRNSSAPFAYPIKIEK